MDTAELKELISSDLYRYAGRSDTKTFLLYFFSCAEFNYSYFFRTCHYAGSREMNFFRKSYFYLCWFMLHHYQIKYGITIPWKTRIGKGLRINHYGCIVVNSGTIIGNNCSISQGVTIGLQLRGKKQGNPTIGDNVWISAGAKIVGNIKIGNNAVIGLNSVVVDDVPDNAVVAGNPGTVISYAGSKEGYLVNPVE
jgi:serine O-acetyltransferase